MPLRIKKPVKIRPHKESFGIEGQDGTILAFVYVEPEPARRLVTKRLSPDDGRELARRLARFIEDEIPGKDD